MDVISIKNLNKIYKGDIKALNNLSLNVPGGQILSLLGTNGAGKSTLFNILTTFLLPTAGEVYLLGKELMTNTNYIRANIACVAQNVSISNHLTIKENMLFQSRLYGLNKKTSNQRMKHLIKIFKLNPYLNKKVSVFSGGIKRRLDIAMSMITYPKILFLDEPTVGLDIQSRHEMWDMLLTIKKELNTTIILTTHYLEEADMLSDTIAFMKNGTIVLQGSPANLKKYIQQTFIKILLNNESDYKNLKTILKSIECIKSHYISQGIIRIQVIDAKLNFQEISQIILNTRIPFKGIEIIEPTLDDLY